MRADELKPEYKDLANDKLMQRQIFNSRKPKVTLAALNKLKKMRAAKDLQNLMRNDFLQIMYGPQEEGGGGGAGGGGMGL
jgi:hypothetical protein